MIFLAGGSMKKVVILGAAGRDFHNFNVLFRNNPDYRVVAFTATQIPDIAGRRYPAALAGPWYPEGIPIIEEDLVEAVIKKEKVDYAVFSYSDISYPKFERVKVCFVAPSEMQLKSDILEYLDRHNVHYELESDISRVVGEVDVVYQT